MESDNNQDKHSMGEHIIKRKWKLLVGIVALIFIVAVAIWGYDYYNYTYIPKKLLNEAVADITNKFETSETEEKLSYAYAIQSGADFGYNGVHDSDIRHELWKLHKPAFEYVEKQAYEGNARGQYLLGKLYDGSPYVQRSKTKAAYWWNEAAMQGYAPAYFDLGMSYKEGKGVKQNMREAIKWLKLGAEAGMADAQNVYGDLFHTGVCESVNAGSLESSAYEELFHGTFPTTPYEQLHFSTFPKTAYNVIIPVDIEKAKYWWKKAAEQGNKEAKDKLQIIY